MDILAFTYEADYHCISCAIKKFGEKVLKTSIGLEDSEGNEPHPVFSTDEYESDSVCGTCDVLIYELCND